MVSRDTRTDVFKEKGFITLLSFKSIDFASTTFLSALELTSVTSMPFSIGLIWIRTVRWLADRMDR